ncbi:hypothetical protein B5807_09390 [Epicoccum nigrum]|uniref:Uncharacterized protein n=1 Tax=Epicoccum nigrum TaxID=105696 RepID=A0A1Y2LM87_EPING|nr:hypothetical protein B5807_09390 [Epicoccum nigrum]
MQLLSQSIRNCHTTRNANTTPANDFSMIIPTTSHVSLYLRGGNSLPICRVPGTKNPPPKPGGWGRSSETIFTGGTSMAKRPWKLGEFRSSGRMRSGVHAPFANVRRSTTCRHEG